LAELKAPVGDAYVVIPALNEERAIRAVALDALRYCGKVIIVDDGSSDGTSAAIADLPVECLRHAQPLGKARALQDGFRRALAHACACVRVPRHRNLHRSRLYCTLIIVRIRLRAACPCSPRWRGAVVLPCDCPPDRS